MNMVTSGLVRVETRMRLGHEPLNLEIPTARMPVGELRHRLLLVVRPTFLPGRMLRLVVIMTLKLICFNGHLLMDRGPLDLMRDWMGCGITRGCLTQIHLLDDDGLFWGANMLPEYFSTNSQKNIYPFQYDVVERDFIMLRGYISLPFVCFWYIQPP